MMDFIRNLLAAIFGILLSPLRLLGWEAKPRAADIAAEAVEAVRAAPIEAPAPVPREPTPMADLLLQHARKRLFTHERHEGLVPLPPALEAWITQLDNNELCDVIGCSARDLQSHVNAGLSGSTARGPYHLPPVLPHAVPNHAKRGATGGTGVKQGRDLSQALEELGLVFDQGYSPRPR
ncbi:hypothetical protein AO398_00385 [Methylobacterium sp. GXS13]|uniref:hypothetical protein n=1 Tax=Methylobacterium sp. GXS13 TaxID=1730094 RepID=UPI00071B6928|nr:hypothetical protein [Methylobacterium sp. GXS13]KST61182.1 hypothetical protein AO398_00385 [Methylobacterium sp. GXS13]